MKNFAVRIFLLLVALAAVIYSCTKSDLATSVDVAGDEQIAQLITYPQGESIDGQYLVAYKEGAISLNSRAVGKDNYWQQREALGEMTQSILAQNKIAPRELLQVYVKALQGFAIQLNDEEVEKLRKDPRIDYIAEDMEVHVTMGGPPGGGGGGGQTTPWGVTRVGGAIDGTNAGTAWIIDSGIDLDHPDLNVDAGRSVSFLSGGGSSSPDDQNGHGTHVAGTVAAINNDIGVVGVAAGATVVAVRVLDRRGSGSTTGVIAGVDYVAANASNGDAANMSLGGGYYAPLNNAVIAASSSCPFALAAGNESTSATTKSPASANGNNIYTVSSMTSTDNWSSFSNYGNPPVDYCAPGSSIPSTYKDGGYATLSGTSMASPHVCGILLIGGITSDGTVNNDPDGNPDPIAHH